MKDAYAQAVEYLTENPGEIDYSWEQPTTAKGGCLFQFADGGNGALMPGCGCLTMIRHSPRSDGSKYRAATEALTRAIRSDNRIPQEDGITVDHLPLFAGWQRRIDRELNRTPPALDPRLPMPKGDIEIPDVGFEMSGGAHCPPGTAEGIGELVREQTC